MKLRGVLVSTGLLVAIGCGGGSPGAKTGPLPTADSPPEQRDALFMFDDSHVYDVRLEMSPEDFQSILDDSRGDELRPATIMIDGVTVTNIGVRPSGESSRVAGNQKMSMRIEFDAFESKRVGGYDEIKLTGSWDDPFLVRDRIGYWVYRQVMPAPRIVAAVLTVNGQSRGAFEIEETWSKESLRERFPDVNGPLYRIRGLTNEDPYAYKGLDAAAYVPLPWDPKGKHDPAQDAVIGQSLRVLTEEPQRIGDVMDLDVLLTYFAASAILSNTDGFTGPFEVDDHYQYYDPTTSKFVILPWDPDNTFGSINDLPDANVFLNYERCLVTRMISEGFLRDAFLNKLEEVMQRVPDTAIQAQIDAVYQQVRPTVDEDTTKMYPTSSFDWSLGYVKDWIHARYLSLNAQIASLRGAPPVTP